jgi:hypothetical protein
MLGEEKSRKSIESTKGRTIEPVDGSAFKKLGSIAHFIRTSIISRRLIIAFCIVMFSMMAGTFFPANPTEVEEYQRLIVATTGDKNFSEILAYIATNNFFVLLLMHIPGLGCVIGLLTIFSTGSILGGFSIMSGLNPVLVFFVNLVIPHSIPELFAFSVALATSAISMRLLLKKEFKAALMHETASLVFSGAILALAAVIEAFLISVLV